MVRCSCAALAGLIQVWEAASIECRERGDVSPFSHTLERVHADAAQTLERELARCAHETGSTVDDVRDLCAMFPPLEDCGRF